MTAPPKDEQQTVPNRTDRARGRVRPRSVLRGSLADALLHALEARGGYMTLADWHAAVAEMVRERGAERQYGSQVQRRLQDGGDITITVEITRQGAKRIGGDL